MKKTIFLLLCVFFVGFSAFSQKKLGFNAKGDKGDKELARQLGADTGELNDELSVKLSAKTKYTDYKIINYKLDTSIVDTTLTLKKEHFFNFRRKDNFELLEFQNQGQTFNNLGYDFSNLNTLTDFGFRAKHFNFYNVDDIYYYQVPTPTTQIMYRSGNEQGQVLDALFTLNLSKRFNVAFEYKGLRSLGYYRRSLASQGNFRVSFHYKTKKGQYSIKGHSAIQDISNQENGGLTNTSLNAFTSNDPNFSNDRGRLDVQLADAENLLDGKRYYIEQSLRLFSTEVPDSIAKKDSLNIATKNFSNLKVGHSVLLDNKFYRFNQTSVTTDFFGDANISGNIENTTEYQLLSNQLFVNFNSKYILGNFKARVTHSLYEYGYRNLINIDAFSNLGINVNKLKGNAVSFGADWNANINKLHFNASATITPGSGRLSGNDLRGEVLYKKDSVFSVKGRLNINSKSPNFNMLFFESNYNAYNWKNNFKNVETRNIGGIFNSKWGNASVDLTNINNYVYFDENGTPQQTSENINYLKVKANKEFRLGKFGLDNTIMYQNVSSGSTVFRVPELVSRNTLYYTDEWFKNKPLLVNIGLTFKYFSKYKANAYNPLLAEFQLQNNTEIGNYPMVDFFFNGRVRRTRIFFKLDNITSFIADKNYFSAPNHPYRDFSIRFGVVWNWFI